jgi:hypothetical protein
LTDSLSFDVTGPVLDPIEFSARFIAHVKGTHSLGHEGGLIAMILVVWAASFGLDECGISEVEHDDTAEHPLPLEESDIHATAASAKSVKKEETERMSEKKSKNATVGRNRERKEKTDAMLREVLELIDFHGVMRRPTWDGVRALLLIIPLMEGCFFFSLHAKYP